jgi:hypothetical protein
MRIYAVDPEKRKAPTVTWQGSKQTCVAHTMAAALAEASNRDITPKEIWKYALMHKLALFNHGVIDGKQGQLAYHFAPHVTYLEKLRIGLSYPYIVGEHDTRVGWFRDILQNGTLIFTNSKHSIYVYNMLTTKRSFFLTKWVLGEYKNVFLGYDPQKGKLVKIPVDAMSQEFVTFVKS